MIGVKPNTKGMPRTAKVRKRLGLIVPSSNTVMEVDFYRNVPHEEITIHTARMFLEDTTVVGEEKMLDVFLEGAVRDIATVRPHVVVFGCTSAGALRGNAYERELCDRISQVTGCPTISVMSSVRRALKDLGVAEVAVVTPYVEELNQRITKSLVDEGLKVTATFGMGIDENFSIATVSPKDILEFVKESVNGVRCEGVFISCTNFRGMEARTEIENLLGLPVITSNQAALQASLDVLSLVP